MIVQTLSDAAMRSSRLIMHGIHRVPESKVWYLILRLLNIKIQMNTDFMLTLESSKGFQSDSDSVTPFLIPAVQDSLGGFVVSFLAGGVLEPTTGLSAQTSYATRWHYADAINDLPHQPIDRCSKNLNLLPGENCFQASRTPPEESGLKPAKASSK